jgi:hypothetical protein
MMKSVIVLLVLLTLGLFYSNGVTQTASYDTVSIHDLQYVTDPGVSDSSLYLGDTVVVHGYVMHSPRALYVGSRWACYITDGTQDPWSGFFIIQDDSSESNTLFGYVQTGDECYFTGRVATYTGLTQLNILTNPVVPISIVSSGNTLPEAKVLTLADVATHAAGEQWESMLIRVEGTTVTNRAYTNNQAVITDGTASGYIDDYFLYYRSQFDNGLNPWPANGTSLNINGFTRDIGQSYFSINPRGDSDFEVLTNPPDISGVRRSPGVPTSSDEVSVSAAIVDNGSVASATLFYSVNWGAFQEIGMTVANGDTFQATIPVSADNSYVRYFIQAVDNVGDMSQIPGDTSTYVYSYVIRNSGLSIKDVQYTWGYSVDNSPFMGYVATLEGVVMTDTLDWINNYYIQAKDSAWYGIWVYDNAHKPNKGDWVSVTGTVQENYNVTRLGYVTDLTVVTPNYGAFDPIQVTTGEITTGGANAEAYESVLIKVVNVTVTNPFPDAPSGNYGEFTVDDGSGGVRVDDAFSAFDGNLDSTFYLDDTIEELIGEHYFSFSNYKILPRNYTDIVNHVAIEDPGDGMNLAKNYALQQNYPNPFNPTTTINFNVPQTTTLRLSVYNLLGQRIRVLLDGVVQAGNRQVVWDGRNEAGNMMGSGIYFYRLEGNGVNMTKKMILMK